MSQDKEGTTTGWSDDNGNKFGINCTVRGLHGILGYSKPLEAQLLLSCRPKNMPKMWFPYKSHANFSTDPFEIILLWFPELLSNISKRKTGEIPSNTTSELVLKICGNFWGGAHWRSGSGHMIKFPGFIKSFHIKLNEKSLDPSSRRRIDFKAVFFFKTMNVDFTVRTCA